MKRSIFDKFASIHQWMEHQRMKRELKAAFRRKPKPAMVKIPDEYQMQHMENERFLNANDKGIPYQCVYCTSDNKAVRDTFYDATCPGCIRRMK